MKIKYLFKNIQLLLSLLLIINLFIIESDLYCFLLLMCALHSSCSPVRVTVNAERIEGILLPSLKTVKRSKVLLKYY
jgi:hypothetical protein